MISLAATTYQWYLAIHIFLAVIWVGGAFVSQMYGLRARATDDPLKIADFSASAEWVGTRVFLPSSLLLVLFGFLLIHEGSWDYDFWVIFGLAVWAGSALTGSLFLGPESGRIAKLTEEKGVESPDVQARIRRIFLISRIELLFLILVVFDMTIKPFFS
jgi:uncharacterized membrane protein